MSEQAVYQEWQAGLVDEVQQTLINLKYNIPAAEKVAPIVVKNMLVKMVQMGEGTQEDAGELLEGAERARELALARHQSGKLLSLVAQAILGVIIEEEPDADPSEDEQP